MKPLYHVLIAEDDPFIRKILRQTLKDDFEVITKENGIEALSWLEEGNPVDIILSDIQMPYMDGKDLLGMLRVSPVFRKVPLIILSSFSDSDTRIKFFKLGADDYIVKPFSPIEVKAKIISVLRRTKADNPEIS
ncbi:response regulator [Spirosoma endophyticum]|uniref:Response regulator receiver domain-containing protein n=1 Tax=Spirosoma endophyticum TaxID=662367 RepID=A0A1I1PSY5_9BACT|nr:response regulator transcription factor [Spirosoma endophyticum]SFD12949.1 Response regulator receiver domain-containing protein [Spirosoma endophyticum]